MNRSVMVSCAVILWICGWLFWLERGTDPLQTGSFAVEAEGTEKTDTREIRVLLLSDDYTSSYHSDLRICSAVGCTLQPEEWLQKLGFEGDSLQGGEELQLTWTDSRIQIQDQSWKASELLSGDGGDAGWTSQSQSEDRVVAKKLFTITASDDQILLPGLERGYDCPAYHGNMEIYVTKQGFLVVNELPLETYLCGVVPSEMPSSYPAEALKAQAICARTYALSQIEEQRMKDFPAQVDDSTAYQVYNNQLSTDATDQAVRDTEGLVLLQDGALADARYYSTSCGLDLHLDLSEEAVFAAFLSEDQLSSWEAEEPLYRWQVQIRLDDLGITEMEVTKRGENGAAETLIVTRRGKTRTIQGEYKIRKFLARGASTVTLQDGSSWETPGLLPSAFFILTPVLEEEELVAYDVLGGGYGHGIGMSQNGAKQMARHGKTCEEILESYYEDTEICSIYEYGN